MDTNYLYLDDLAKIITNIPEDSIISRSVYEDERMKVVLFGFAPGQALSEHTASQPATLTFLQGEATLTLGDETMEAQPGTWVYMPAHLPHSVVAKSSVVMLLHLLRE
jgi:quercetin dioxygenase-like cupin family protein